MAYIKEGRVGFYIRSLERWEDNEGVVGHGEYPFDFCIEVDYDWKKDAPAYQIFYEVYGMPYESDNCGTVYYPQIRGIDKNVQNVLNMAMKENVIENLQYIDIDEWQIKLNDYNNNKEYWYIEGAPEIGRFIITYQTENYLCLFQDINLGQDDVLRFAEEWKRYHVYDINTGKSLKLGNVIRLDEEFVRWLKEEKRIEATGEYYDGVGIVHTEMMEISLDGYSEDLLLSVLENAEFWMKSGQLFIRLPHYDEKSGGLWYLLGGSSWPNYIQYAETRISLEDLGEFLLVEPW